MQTYKLEEVQELTKNYFKGDELATNVWINKYCLKNETGELLERTPDDMHHRLAKEFARIEQNYPNPLSEEEIYGLLKDFEYIVPQGSPMYGIGNNFSITSLSNCFFVGNNNDSDSYGSIMRTDEEQIQLMKRRGGVGHDISHLRPSGAIANNSILTGLAGATLYMERFSNSTREVSQGSRRGALMLSVDVRHPDTDKFIDMKLEQGKVTGANVSIKITDEFMNSLEKDDSFYQCFPIDFLNDKSSDIFLHNHDLNKLIKIGGACPDSGYLKRIEAKKLWDKIIYNAWKSAEPGILFWDKFKSESPSDCYQGFEIQGVNPCSELCLPEYGSCILMALNLYSFVDNPFSSQATFNWDKFREYSRIAQKLMDDLVDLEIEKVDKIIQKIESDKESDDIKRVELNLWKKIKEKSVETRRTGLGITAEGDMIAAMNLRFGTDEATKFAVEVHRVLAVESYKSSIDMASERGAFSIFDKNKEIGHPFLSRIYSELESDELEYGFQAKWLLYGRRNIANLTIAPTGSLSICTQTTSGIEPLFAPFYKRRTKTEDKTKTTFIDEQGDMWQEYFVIHPKFKEWYEVNWKNLDNCSEYYVPLEGYNEEGLQKFFEQSPYYKATANDIDWKASVRMQGEIQKWVDHSISKTVNLPETATIEEVDQLYREAYRAGCKGVTVYREGSREGVLISSKDKKKEEGFEYKNAFKRLQTLECDIYHKTAMKQNWMVMVGKVEGRPYEIFVIKDVDNHIFPSKIEKGKITKVKSRMYRLEGYLSQKLYTIDNIVDLMSEDEKMDTRKYSSMLRHGMAPRFIIDQIEEYATIVSFDKVVQRVLKNYVGEEKTKGDLCPECGSTLIMTEGCKKCLCGYAKCG
jgi:ribonucleoside-diphosphate reductase alpha chain